MRSVVVVLPASTCAMTPMLRRLRRGVLVLDMMNLSGRGRRVAPPGECCLSQPPPGDSPGRSAACSSPVAGARAWFVHVPAVGNRGDQLVVRAHGVPCRLREIRKPSAEKTKPRETAPAGVLVGRQGTAALRRDVEERSGGLRGLVHLAYAGKEVVSGFHDGCHYLAATIALQAVMALEALPFAARLAAKPGRRPGQRRLAGVNRRVVALVGADQQAARDRARLEQFHQRVAAGRLGQRLARAEREHLERVAVTAVARRRIRWKPAMLKVGVAAQRARPPARRRRRPARPGAANRPASAGRSRSRVPAGAGWASRRPRRSVRPTSLRRGTPRPLQRRRTPSPSAV